MRKSRVWDVDKTMLIYYIKQSNSVGEVLTKLGLVGYKSGNYKTFYNRIKKENIDISKLKERTKEIYRCRGKNGINPKISLKKILIKNSKYTNNSCLKKRLIDCGKLKNICYICGMKPLWNGKTLSLQLDHKNGINNDNRLSNLRLCCPNCHSQTKTYCGKNKRASGGMEDA